MQKLKYTAVIAGLAIVVSSSLAFADSEHDERIARLDRVPGQYIVVFSDSASFLDATEAELLGRVHATRLSSYRSALKGFSARMSPLDAMAMAQDPRVAYVVLDGIVTVDQSRDRGGRQNPPPTTPPPTPPPTNPPPPPPPSTPPPSQSTQTVPTGIARVGAVGKSNTGAGVDVAVIDTGIDVNHPDLSSHIAGGTNCVPGSSSYVDQNGHGTHVAGTIGAIANTFGVVGVAPDVRLWSVRVLDANGSGTWSSVICGIDFVTSMSPAYGGPIKVANLSLGGSGAPDANCGYTNNDPLHMAICRARDAGVTVVVAAGNSSANTATNIPAGYDDAVITVSALVDTDGLIGGAGAASSYGADDTFATFSNYGSAIDIGAPGVNIKSTLRGGGYGYMSGTSMATPHVTGAAALYIATHPSALWSEVRDRLISSAEPAGAGHIDTSGKHSEPVLRVDSL